MENCVICSHLSLILQAVIPPARSSLIYSNKLRWDEFFPCFLCIACLSSLVSQQSFFYHPFFLPSYWICSLLSFPYRFLLFVPNLSSLLSAGCCCGSDLSGSGRAKKADKSSSCLTSVADTQIKTLGLGFKHPMRKGGESEERTDARIRLCLSLQLIMTLVCSKDMSNPGRRRGEAEEEIKRLPHK